MGRATTQWKAYTISYENTQRCANLHAIGQIVSECCNHKHTQAEDPNFLLSDHLGLEFLVVVALA